VAAGEKCGRQMGNTPAGVKPAIYAGRHCLAGSCPVRGNPATLQSCHRRRLGAAVTGLAHWGMARRRQGRPRRYHDPSITNSGGQVTARGDEQQVRESVSTGPGRPLFSGMNPHAGRERFPATHRRTASGADFLAIANLVASGSSSRHLQDTVDATDSSWPRKTGCPAGTSVSHDRPPSPDRPRRPGIDLIIRR